MGINTEITNENILEQVKMSLKISNITEQIFTRRIIETEGQKAGIKIEVSELQSAADSFRVKHKLGSADRTQSWLDLNQISIDDFEGVIRLELLSEKLADHILAEEVEKYFYQHQLDFDRAVLSEIVLEDKALAMELYYSIREEEVQFQDVAKKYIKDKEQKYTGGYLGALRRKDLHIEASSIFAVNSWPQIIKPVTSAQGIHLVWIEEIIKAELDPKIHKEIKSQLFGEFLKDRLKEYY
jgi:parvulin-like peptidyl-prolyl isomerase